MLLKMGNSYEDSFNKVLMQYWRGKDYPKDN